MALANEWNCCSGENACQVGASITAQVGANQREATLPPFHFFRAGFQARSHKGTTGTSEPDLKTDWEL